MDSKPGQPVQEEPASRAAVTASVLFYLVAALVVRAYPRLEYLNDS